MACRNLKSFGNGQYLTLNQEYSMIAGILRIRRIIHGFTTAKDGDFLDIIQVVHKSENRFASTPAGVAYRL